MDRAKTRWFKQGIWIIERKIRNFLIKVNDIPCLTQELLGREKRKWWKIFFIDIRLISYKILLNFLHFLEEILTTRTRMNCQNKTEKIIYISFLIITTDIILSKFWAVPLLKKKSLKFCNNFPKAVSDVKK